MSRHVLSTIVLLAIFAPSAIGGVVFHVDMNSATPEIETSLQTVPGGVVNVGIVMEISGMEASAYGVSVRLDPAHFLIGTVATHPPTGFLELAPPTVRAGEIQTISAATFGGSVSDGSHTIATFPAVAQTNLASNIELFLRTGIDGVNDMSNDPVDLSLITTNFGAINAVPEPSSWMLFALLSVALGARRYFPLRRHHD